MNIRDEILANRLASEINERWDVNCQTADAKAIIDALERRGVVVRWHSTESIGRPLSRFESGDDPPPSWGEDPPTSIRKGGKR